MIRFFVLFTVLLVGLFTLEILQPAEKYVILPFTSFIADISVWIIQSFDDNVHAISNVIRDRTNGFGVRIERGGCVGRHAALVAKKADDLGILRVDGGKLHVLRLLTKVKGHAPSTSPTSMAASTSSSASETSGSSANGSSGSA